ncbi:O-acetyl-ADP-ribose deacetylase, partial [Luteococcus sp. H101]|uniref:O-acetyl-ADP-ribose deacetylase n=1 Tax=Luteococcus sp. H101 TaxID=3139402 RepID=UPI00313D24F3
TPNSVWWVGGGGGATPHRRGGPEILAACQQLRASSLPDGLPAGQAVATTAGKLDARWVIHTVGPVWAKTIDKSATLASCYRECLREADELGATSVAFPTISAGVYGWPMDDATRIAVQTVRETPTNVQRVILVAFNEAAEVGYRQALQAWGKH